MTLASLAPRDLAHAGRAPSFVTARQRAIGRRLEAAELRTPAFVYAAPDLDGTASRLAGVAAAAGCELLYAVKAGSAPSVLETIAPHVAGFAASSLAEARLARRVGGAAARVHLTTPGLRPDEVDAIAAACDHVSCNSLSQLERFGRVLGAQASVGLRLNPQRSFVSDPRHDPSRPHSKLGVTLEALRAGLARDPALLDGVRGLHVHGNCDSRDLGELAATARWIRDLPGRALADIEWVNLGGGYLFDDEHAARGLAAAVRPLADLGARVVVEPGAAFVRAAGYLVASVVDVFDSAGMPVAVLDTSVNHLPEVFEYQFEPEVLGHDPQAAHCCILAGASCLAGDVFGECRFERPLASGARVVFTDVGAYSLVKAHSFNGIALPALHTLSGDGSLRIERTHGTSDHPEPREGEAIAPA